ncbi:MAG: 16S rRNA (cytidine(1402)-2'-O)-methyltransferase [Lachnospiraceae bacterium]|jgi:16S rRNA (cytidine1402-2'-O)-methyltransferase|nr:16S rRNA (cytidine(1402)-2'-O)-methyltransferase [Lachnospiraceae bacterium]
MQGMLYLCPTPIGNLGDISQRTLETLQAVDLIAAEDTRSTGLLLKQYHIQTPLISYHQHNERERSEELIHKIKEGRQIALVTDAGMPAISDPGQILVRRCHEAGVLVTALPGPCAFVTALALSGLDSRRFTFEGFLPADKKECQQVLADLRESTKTTIFYEAPHRLKQTLKLLSEAAGERPAAAVRELTKKFEEVRLLPLRELAAYYEEHEPRGEFVILIEGKTKEQRLAEQQKRYEALSIEEHMALYAELPEKEAMKAVAKDRGITKRDVYAQLKK